MCGPRRNAQDCHVGHTPDDGRQPELLDGAVIACPDAAEAAQMPPEPRGAGQSQGTDALRKVNNFRPVAARRPQLHAMDQQCFGKLNAVTAAEVSTANAHNEVEAAKASQGGQIVAVIAPEARLASAQRYTREIKTFGIRGTQCEVDGLGGE